MFDQFTGKIIETGYETNSNILKKAYERRLNRKDDFKLNDENIFKIEELFQAMLKPISSEQINSFQLSKVDGFCSEKPNGTSTPEGDYAKKY